MKLLEFVKKHPSHAKGAICILAVGFAACFSALVVLGAVVYHGRTVEKNTNAVLVAGDILAIREIRLESTGEKESEYRALIDARASSCLSYADVLTLCEILTANDSRFIALCDTLQSAFEENRCTAAVLSSAIREYSTGEKQTTYSAPGETPALAGGRQGFALYDAKGLAEDFFGVRLVFRKAGSVAYCRNLCSRFNEKNGRFLSFSAEWHVEGDVKMSPEACVDMARTFAEKRAGIKTVSTEMSGLFDGAYWVNVTDYNSKRWTIGVCGETGRVCFCCQLPEEHA